MAAIAMMVGGALTNALAFTGSNFLISSMASSAERKRHDLALEQLQRDRDEWNQARLQRIDFINEQLKKQDHSERTFEDVDEAMRQYYNITGIRLDALPEEPQLKDYLDEDQTESIEKIEIGVALVGTLGVGYLAYRYL